MATLANTVTAPASSNVDPGFNIGTPGVPSIPNVPNAASMISTSAGGAYGGVPGGTDPQGAQSAAIGGNLSQLSNLYQLATGMGAASGAGASANLNTALPGASNGLAQELQLAESDLSGQLSPSTLNNLEQVSAERGVSTGDIGSPNSNAALMSLLGNTTEQLQQTGVQDLTSAISSAPVGPAYDPASQQVTPGQDIAALQQNAQNAAQPNPAAAAAQNMAALQAGLQAGKAPAKVGVLPTGTTGGIPSGGGGIGTSSSDSFMNSPDASYGSVVGYGPGGSYGSSISGGAPGTMGTNASNIPTGDTLGGASYDPTGATAYQQEFGEALQPGQTYDAKTGLVSDFNNGQTFDPGTGLTFDLATGDVVPDDQSTFTNDTDSVYAASEDDSGD